MRHKRAVGAAVAVGLVVSGTAFGANQLQQGPDAVDELDIVHSGQAATLTADEREMLTGGMVDDYGLDLSAARVAERPAADRARGAASGRWVVVPGEDGACLVPGDNSLTCAPAAAVERGLLVMSTMPMPTGRYVPGKAPPIGPGPGKFQGVAPDGVTQVNGLDEAGKQIASTSVTDNVYELRIASYRDLADLELVRADGTSTRLPLGPRSR